MGLTLEVGLLADLHENDHEALDALRDELTSINKTLRKHSLGPHEEPIDCAVWSCDMIGHSGLHYLRRLAANLDLGGELPTPGDETNIDDDELTEKYYELAEGPSGAFSFLAPQHAGPTRKFDHLIVHGDDRGFYLPIDFAGPISFETKQSGPGWLGSAVRLLEECEILATRLQIPPDAGVDDMDEQSDSPWQSYWTEAYSCVALREGCLKSIESGAMLAFV